MLQCKQDITNWYNAVESHWYFECQICHFLAKCYSVVQSQLSNQMQTTNNQTT